MLSFDETMRKELADSFEKSIILHYKHDYKIRHFFLKLINDFRKGKYAKKKN